MSSLINNKRSNEKSLLKHETYCPLIDTRNNAPFTYLTIRNIYFYEEATETIFITKV